MLRVLGSPKDLPRTHTSLSSEDITAYNCLLPTPSSDILFLWALTELLQPGWAGLAKSYSLRNQTDLVYFGWLRSFLLSSFAGGLEVGSSCLEWRGGKMLREWLPSTGIAGSIQYYCLRAVPLGSSEKAPQDFPGQMDEKEGSCSTKPFLPQAMCLAISLSLNIPPAWIIPYSCLSAIGSFYPTHLSTAAHGTVLRHNSETTALG